MIKRLVALCVVLILIFNFASCGKKATRYEAEFLLLFDTVTKIVGYSDSRDEFDKFSQLIYDNLKELNQLYDIYKDYEGINNVKTINDNAGISPVVVDKRIIDLINFSKKAYEITGGEVNIAFGSVLSIWHDYRTEGIDEPENAELPPMEKLQVASKHTDINKVIVDEEKSTVYLDDPKMSLDVGAIAKGYATEQVCQIAIKNGYTSGLVSVGGNVRAIGDKGNNQLWNVGIQNPDMESDQSTLDVTYLKDLSLVTSGDYQRYYTVNGKKYHHIIDPKTLMPTEYFTAVTIVCRDSGMADALSTAVFNMPFEQGLEFINNLSGTEALWVMKDGEIRYSDNFKAYLKEK